jgi:anti-sigma regulatory factor (Ser/Thr protein kinase)
VSHPPPEHVLLSRSFDGGQLATLRRTVAKHAAEVGLLDSRRQDFVLAVDEVVTNAVRHGGGHGRLDVWVAEGQLWFRVSDAGPGLAAPLPAHAPEPTLPGGRGLWITRHVTDDLTITTGPLGTTVTGAMALPASSASAPAPPPGPPQR